MHILFCILHTLECILQVPLLYIENNQYILQTSKETAKREQKGKKEMSEIIRVNNLKKYYKETKAVDDISFTVERGELFGFLGVNGAGKTTTISMLCTLLEPTEGSAEIAGFQLGKGDEEIKKRIGVVYQDNCLDDILTVKENLMYRGGLYETSTKRVKQRIEQLSEILDLKEIHNQKFGSLSGGQKRRCEIARALMHTPEILFLDEPTTGLDPASRKSVWETVGKLQKDMGMTVFLTTHYMEEAARANHIGIMQKGHLIEYATPSELKTRYAKDKLLLFPKDMQTEEIMLRLDKMEQAYKIKENRIQIQLADTIAALPIMEQVKSLVNGFEVVQGNMDDVFLNATQATM